MYKKVQVLSFFSFTNCLIIISIGIATSFVTANSMSTATLELRGRVPETTRVSTLSLNSDLDLRPGSTVTATKIGQVQIKANSEISGIFVSSNTKSGTPENAESQPFKLSKPFTLQVGGDCKSLKTDAGFVLSHLEKNIATAELTQLNQRDPVKGGITENCDLSASWSSEPIVEKTFQKKKKLVNSGLYSMYITVTLVSQ